MLTAGARRRHAAALLHLLESGPADIVAAILTLPQLRNEWPQLELSDLLRCAWEDARAFLTHLNECARLLRRAVLQRGK